MDQIYTAVMSIWLLWNLKGWLSSWKSAPMTWKYGRYLTGSIYVSSFGTEIDPRALTIPLFRASRISHSDRTLCWTEKFGCNGRHESRIRSIGWYFLKREWSTRIYGWKSISKSEKNFENLDWPPISLWGKFHTNRVIYDSKIPVLAWHTNGLMINSFKGTLW